MGNVIIGLDDHVTEKKTQLGSAQDGTLRYAASAMKGFRKTMEDCHVLCESIPVEGKDEPLSGHSLFAVYDGHGGGFTSQYAGERFVRLFSHRHEWKKYANSPAEGDRSRVDVSGVELIRSALKRTFLQLDEELQNLHEQRNDYVLRQAATIQPSSGCDRKHLKWERSGSTCVVVVITPSHLICANAGDSRAILRRKERVLPLSFDHKPSNVAEQERIVSAGGYVRGKRVDGDLAVSRGLGDFSYKSNKDLPTWKQKVIAVPDFIVYPRDEENDEFLVLACDGIWDVTSNEHCGTMIQEILDEGEANIDLVCEEVLDCCLEKNSRDNMSIVMVGFPAMKMCRSSLMARNAVRNRRTARQRRLVEAQARLMADHAVARVGLKNLASRKKTEQFDKVLATA